MITRRQALAGGVSCALAGTAALAVSCVPTEAPAAAHDPVLTLIERWNELSAELEQIHGGQAEAFYEQFLGPIEQQVANGVVPDATSAKGAVAALRKVLSFGDLENQDANLVRSALAYLEGRA